MKIRNLLFALVAVLIGTAICFSQKNSAVIKPIPTADLQSIHSSAAYADLLLQKTELQSSLDSLLVDYTEEHPKVKEIRVELRYLQSEMDRVLAVRPENAARLTDALGKLMLRKVQLEAELDNLRTQYKDDYPDVRKAKKQVDAFEAAIKEILG